MNSAIILQIVLLHCGSKASNVNVLSVDCGSVGHKTVVWFVTCQCESWYSSLVSRIPEWIIGLQCASCYASLDPGIVTRVVDFLVLNLRFQ